MALALILIAKRFQTDESWLHVPSFLSQNIPVVMGQHIRGGDWAKLVYWDMIIPKPDQRDDGSSRTGYWIISVLGMRFSANQIRVPAHAFVYNANCFGLDDSTTVSIVEALDELFDYNELMG